MDSGLWHHTQRSGHPFTKKVVRIPGPSWIAIRFVSSIRGSRQCIFPPARSSESVPTAADAAINSRKCLRVVSMYRSESHALQPINDASFSGSDINITVETMAGFGIDEELRGNLPLVQLTIKKHEFHEAQNQAKGKLEPLSDHTPRHMQTAHFPAGHDQLMPQ